MKYILSFSGGKDSTAMLLRALEEGLPIDEIIYVDTGKEFPDMVNHINKVRTYIKQKYNREITTLSPEKTFDYWMFDHIKTKGTKKGEKGYGWPDSKIRWCTKALKTWILMRYLKKYKEEGYQEYVGIAFDEQKRIKDKIYPLVEWEMTEKDCLQYCYDKGFDWNGLYEHFNRVSCWCCPLKNIKELEVLYKYYPELWEQLKDMDRRSKNTFKPEYTVEELEAKFKKKK